MNRQQQSQRRALIARGRADIVSCGRGEQDDFAIDFDPALGGFWTGWVDKNEHRAKRRFKTHHQS